MTDPRRTAGALLALVWVTAVSCRTALLGVGPVLPLIVAEAGLSFRLAGLLYSLPVLAMGVVAIPGGVLADRIGAARVVAGGLLVAAVAGALRAEGSAAALFVGAALLGAAVGVVQPALPRVVRERFPDRIGLGTAVYSFGFTGGSVLAVALTPWLAPRLGGWRGTFLVWAVLAAVTAPAWWVMDAGGLTRRGAARSPETGPPLPPVARSGFAGPRSSTARLDLGAFGDVLRDRLLWRIALLQAMNSAAFYGANAWLTQRYVDLGFPLGRAAAPLVVFNAVGAAAGLASPIVSDRVRRRRPILVWTCALSVVGAAALLAAPESAPLVWSAVFGVGLFASYTVNLAMPVDIAPAARVGAATGVVFSVGHAAALLGPLLWGQLLDATGRHEAGLGVLVAMTAVMTGLAVSLPETWGGTPGRKAGRAEPG